MKQLICIIACLFLSTLLASCAGETRPEQITKFEFSNKSDLPKEFLSDKAEVIFEYNFNGGCAWGENNCEEIQVFNSGQFVVKRFGTEELIAYGTIDDEILADWKNNTSYDDLSSLEFEPGVCMSCIDGVDFTYVIRTDKNLITLKSLDVKFPWTEEPFFIESKKLMTEVRIKRTAITP